VYKNVVVPPTPVSGDTIRQAVQKGDVDYIGQLLHNRLQLAAERLDPRIAEYARMLVETKPAGCLMSGSGSTLFALCRSADEAGRVAANLERSMTAHEFKLIVTRTV
jgi:4-diphosphocytidyl-2-C-methyl-D-erythritol kinase